MKLATAAVPSWVTCSYTTPSVSLLQPPTDDERLEQYLGPNGNLRFEPMTDVRFEWCWVCSGAGPDDRAPVCWVPWGSDVQDLRSGPRQPQASLQGPVTW